MRSIPKFIDFHSKENVTNHSSKYTKTKETALNKVPFSKKRELEFKCICLCCNVYSNYELL